MLSAKDAKGALFGIDMQGYVQEADAAGHETGRGMSWRECIDPKGETLYETPGRTEHGRLRIDGEGHACFAYEGTGYSDWSCFSAARTPKGFQFCWQFRRCLRHHAGANRSEKLQAAQRPDRLGALPEETPSHGG